jgi:hypothetical protein
MKETTRKQKNSNVLPITGNPQFKAKVCLPLTSATKGDVYCLSLTADVFGLLRGDTVICRADYDADTISENALVIDDRDGKKVLTIYANASNIAGVVTAYMREIKND